MSLKSLLLQNRIFCKCILVAICFLNLNIAHCQISNYVTNGGFEDYYTCATPPRINNVKGWRTLDSAFNAVVKYFNVCVPNVPVDGLNVRYQWPHKGNAFGGATFLFQPPCPPCPTTNIRGYFRNRLKGTLISGHQYCVKFYYNVVNNSNYGINSFGAYLGGNELDTITKGSVRITYISPQVSNLGMNFATDTLGWKSITGTFIASGNEKYMVIGNFKSDTLTSKVLINPTITTYIFSDMNIDHVSCIDVDLPAFAGNDTSCIPGTSIYLGRQRDVGIDEACMWYKLPMVITPTTPAIDTAAGIWVSPTQTSTYVVRQEICGNVKWDTVIVYKDAVGFGEFLIKNEELKIFPVPANQSIELQVSNIHLFSDFTSVSIHNSFGQLIREEDILFKTEKTLISTSSLPNGVYSLSLKNSRQETLSKKFVIYR